MGAQQHRPSILSQAALSISVKVLSIHIPRPTHHNLVLITQRHLLTRMTAISRREEEVIPPLREEAVRVLTRILPCIHEQTGFIQC